MFINLRIILGFFLLLSVLVAWFIPIESNFRNGMIFTLVWSVGYLLICEETIKHYAGKTHLNYLKSNYPQIFIVGLLSSIVIEGTSNWGWKLWYYPIFSTSEYLIIIPLLLWFYFYLLLRGYIAVQLILINYFGHSPRISFRPRYLKLVFALIGLIGLIGMGISLTHTFLNFTYDGLFNIFNSYGVHQFSFLDLILFSISLFFIFEFLEFNFHQDSCILHMIEGDFRPFFAVLIASLLTSLSMELYNHPIKVWLYTNWLWSDTNILGIPILVILCWPFQYFIFIAIYRVMYPKLTKKIWD